MKRSIWTSVIDGHHIFNKLLKSCSICKKSTRWNQKEPLVQESALPYPFQKVSIAIYEYAGVILLC